MKLKKLLLILAVVFGATAATVDETPVKVQALTSQYTVKTGDTLSGIAHELYGRASAWKDLQNSNPGLIKNEHLITPGMVIAYSVEAAEQSMAQVLRAKEMRKLAGKSDATASKTIKKSTVVSAVQFGPAPLVKPALVKPIVKVIKKQQSRKIASVRVPEPKAVAKPEAATSVKKPSKNPIGLNGFKDLEF